MIYESVNLIRSGRIVTISGGTITAKLTVPDLKVHMNDQKFILAEMQGFAFWKNNRPYFSLPVLYFRFAMPYSVTVPNDRYRD